ncbi:hypothetical protein KIPB_004052 [Kipferlia bialata]|uniref:Uncharacterized protein n=1 Tax=Kipferlia bialata TaxID=797122 RepID=A0A9K3CT72_9EUKA|nr:hypothetical protein KIPB_002171 [Kipferlia bialata]GIQ82838.1 hypothetical protein KIPB_004052 [Kipferlia bialata]|eukprot:g2171.t1
MPLLRRRIWSPSCCVPERHDTAFEVFHALSTELQTLDEMDTNLQQKINVLRRLVDSPDIGELDLSRHRQELVYYGVSLLKLQRLRPLLEEKLHCLSMYTARTEVEECMRVTEQDGVTTTPQLDAAVTPGNREGVTLDDVARSVRQAELDWEALT